MSAVWYRFRAELRSRWRAWLALALLMGLASGAVMALAAGARRTDSAYSRFLRAQNAYDVLVLNYPEDGTAVFDFEELEQLPEVADSARASFEYYTFDAGNLASEDGRIGTELNRFKILEGRRADPDEPGEMVVGFTLAEAHAIEVGDTVDLLPREFIELVESGATEDPNGEATPDDIASARRILEGVPGGKLRVVGIEAAPGEFPPQFAVNRPLVHLTPAFHRLVGDTEHEALLVRLRGGSDSVEDFIGELERRSGGTEAQVIAQRDHAAAVERSLHLQAVALWLLAGLTALAVVLILGQLLARLTYLESAEYPALGALGMAPWARVVLGVLRAAVIATAGAAVGVAGAFLASGLFPTGLARTAEPVPGLDSDPRVLLFGWALTIVIVTALTAWPAWRTSRFEFAPRQSGARSPLLPRALAGRRLPPPAAVGLGMAFEPGGGRNAVPVRSTLAGVVLGITVLVAALTFGASLAHLLDTPRLYGVAWDVELVNFDPDEGTEFAPEVAELLHDDERVAALALGTASFGGSIEVNDKRVDAVVLESVKGELRPPLLEGRAPDGADEIALGARTLRSLDAELGDTVQVQLPGARGVPMRVVGTAVFPTVSEFAQLGEGALITFEGAAAADPSFDDLEFGLVLRFRPGADGEAVVADVHEQLDIEVFPYEVGEPTDIVNFGRVEAMPFVLGAILATISAATLGHLLVSGVRRRRRDLAVLKTLGFVRGQVAGAVAVQATAVAVIGLLVGIPVGVALGRWVWGLMAESLGVIAQPVVPVLVLLLVGAAALVLANLIAVIPGQLAARTRATTDLQPD